MDQRCGIISASKTKDNNDEPPRSVSNREIRQIFEGGVNTDTLPEMRHIYQLLIPGDASAEALTQLHQDVSRIFAGEYGGFRESRVKYHDLRHTRSVTLATLRLFHGLQCEGIILDQDVIRLGIVCAYFHDTGMLLTDQDSGESGATYLKKHEERSIHFLREYLRENNYPDSYRDDCVSIINCTNLTIDPVDIQFRSPELEQAGYILGTADIVAQMADRYYLESLKLLYLEQQNAGIHHHPSALALMRQTTKFYHEVIEERLCKKFGNLWRFMRAHFRERWNIDRPLYAEFMGKNIDYLEEVISWHDNGKGDMSLYLRRRQPKVR